MAATWQNFHPDLADYPESELKFTVAMEKIAATMREAELIEKRRENERAMQKQALELQLREDKRNDLESFIYNTRDKISSQYASIVTDEEKAAVPGVLEKAELWLEDHFEDGTLAEFQQKLLELQDIVRPITDRYAASQEGSPLHTAKAELQAVVKEATEILSTRSPVNEKSMEELEAEVRKAKDLESSDPEEYALCAPIVVQRDAKLIHLRSVR